MLGKRVSQSLPKTSTLTHNPQIKQLKTAHARSIDKEKNYASGVRIMLGTILGRFSIIYFRGLGLRIRVRVWVRARVRVWVRVRIGVWVSVVLWPW